MFNLLILPNLLKIFSGEHDSLSCEGPVRIDNVEELTARFFDIDTWWPVEGFEDAPFSALGTLVWITWRLYSAAAMIDSKTLATLTTRAFFVGGPNVDMSGVPDPRLRSIIWHLQRRIDEGFRSLLSMPLDALANEFLGLEGGVALNGGAGSTLGGGMGNGSAAASQAHKAKALEQRLSALLLKPEEMLTATVIGRHELANLFSDVGIAAETIGSAHDANGSTPLHRAITDYLVINDELGGDEMGEEIMCVPIRITGQGLGLLGERLEKPSHSTALQPPPVRARFRSLFSQRYWPAHVWHSP
jgi:hypothetical protein